MKQKNSFNYRDFTERNDLISAWAIAWNWILIVGSAVLHFQLEGVYFWATLPLSSFFIASRMNGLIDALGHEASHYNLFGKKSLNTELEFFYFLPVFETFSRYRTEHMLHHKAVMAENDPSRLSYERWGLLQPKINWFYVWYIRPFLFWDTWYHVRTVGEDLVADREFRNKMLLFWIPVLLVFGLTGGLHLLFLYWILPWLWIRPAIEFWTEVNDHLNVKAGETRDSRGWLYRGFLRLHHDGFHALHHRYPKIPWYNLPKAHKAWKHSGDAFEVAHGLQDTLSQIRK